MTVSARYDDADDAEPVLRILAAPDTEPPYDPEPFWDRPPSRGRQAEQLPLDWTGAAARMPDPAPAPATPPGARRAAYRMAIAYLEVVQGRRAKGQLAGLATPTGSDSIDRDLSLAPRQADRIRIHRIHVTEPLPGIAEVVVLLAAADRVWSLALRLEHRDGAWRCAWLETVGRDRMTAGPVRRRGQRTRANRQAATTTNATVQPAVRHTSSATDR